MAEFPTGVNPPGGMSYAAPLVNFAALGELGNDYYEGAEQKRKYDLARVFKDGVPTDAQGNPDYRAITAALAQKGGYGAIGQLADAAAAQQVVPLSPIFGGGAPQGQPQGQPGMPQGQPGQGMPQQGQGGAPMPAPMPPGGQTPPPQLPPTPARPAVADAGGGSLRDLVGAALPANSPVTNQVVGSIAAKLGVDPAAPLTVGQQRRAAGLLKSYALPGPDSAPPVSGNARVAGGFEGVEADAVKRAALQQGQPAAGGQQVAPVAGGQPQPGPAASAPTGPIVPPLTSLRTNRPFTGPQEMQEERGAIQQALVGMMRLPAAQQNSESAKQQRDMLNYQLKKIDAAQQPISVGANERLVDPSTGREVYRGDGGGNPSNIALHRFLSEHPDATAEQIQAFNQLGKPARSAVATVTQKYLQEHPDATADELKNYLQNYTAETAAKKLQVAGDVRAISNSLNKAVMAKSAIESFENTAIKNGEVLVQLAEKVDQTGIPVFERWLRAGRKSIAGDTDVAKFNAQWLLFNTEAAKILSNPNMSGVLSDSARHEMTEVMPNASSAAQIREVFKLLKSDFGRRKEAQNEQIETLRAQLERGKLDRPTSDAPTSAPSSSAPAASGENWTSLPNGVRIREVK